MALKLPAPHLNARLCENLLLIKAIDGWLIIKETKCFFHLTFITQGIDVKSMGRIFVGLVKCGAWGCFDEFNRLEEAVLSAVSMQIQAIQDSLKHQKKTCDLLGKEVGRWRKNVEADMLLLN